MDTDKPNRIAKHWIESSDNDFKTMNKLFNAKEYSWSLFVGHLVIEKLLKGYFVLKTSTPAPFIHNLLKIADKGNLEIPEDVKLLLDVINSFNLSARYDSEKQAFRKKCTRVFTEQMIREIKKLRLWIKEKL